MTGSCQVDSPQGITRAGKPSKRLGFSAHARGNILNTNVTYNKHTYIMKFNELRPMSLIYTQLWVPETTVWGQVATAPLLMQWRYSALAPYRWIICQRFAYTCMSYSGACPKRSQRSTAMSPLLRAVKTSLPHRINDHSNTLRVRAVRF